jgi:transcriptional regulator with GAF, ATPase, and Fis domain
MPPLREIKEDIPLLVDHFLEKTACDVSTKKLPPEVMNYLLNKIGPGIFGSWKIRSEDGVP